MLNMELKNLIVIKTDDLKKEEKIDKKPILELKKDVKFKKNMKSLGKLAEIMGKWIEMQETVNCLLDSSKSSKLGEKDSTGIRQLLEKKEGLFRMKMMGKRYL